jgi:hypothetical protein
MDSADFGNSSLREDHADVAKPDLGDELHVPRADPLTG